MNYLKVSFICRLETCAQFSAWKGSMLRGAMGANLRRGLCMSHKEDCSTCMLNSGCVFPKLFSPINKAGKTPPPFCVETDPEQKTAYVPGEGFKFKLILFSYAVEYLPFYIQAFRIAGGNGLGNKRFPGRFSIEEVLCQEDSIYDKEKDKLHIPVSAKLSLPSPLAETAMNKLDIELLTPLRFKSTNQFSQNLDFANLFNLILRRISALQALENNDWRMDAEQFAYLQAEAKKVSIYSNESSWQDLGRYSSRQDSLMKFGGLRGKISYLGPVSIFKDFINYARICHIGKQTSFGLGSLNFSLSLK